MNKERYQKYILKQRELNKDKVCKFCKKQHDHTFGTGEFCSIECRAKYAAQKSKVSQKSIDHRKKLIESGVFGNKRSSYGSWKCNICGKIFNSRKELLNHIRLYHNQKYKLIKISDTIFKCPYCNYIGSKHQTMAHILSCKNNPDKNLYQLIHKQISDKTKEKISKSVSDFLSSNKYIDTYHKVKWYKVKNINNEEYVVRGMWEVNVSKRLNDIGILWTKSKPIPYVKDNIIHNYTPDFFIPSKDIYIEVKGLFPERDRIKMKLVHDQHPELKIYFIHNQYYQFINGKVDFNDNLLLTESDL